MLPDCVLAQQVAVVTACVVGLLAVLVLADLEEVTKVPVGRVLGEHAEWLTLGADGDHGGHIGVPSYGRQAAREREELLPEGDGQHLSGEGLN